MAESTTDTTKNIVGQDASLWLNDGRATLKKREVAFAAADAVGVSYSWSFRGLPRDNFAPWAAVHRLSLKVGPSGEHKPSTWKDSFKKIKPSTTGLKVVGKTCSITVRDLGLDDETRNTVFKGYLLAIDQHGIQFVHNQFGIVYITFVAHQYVVDVEYREKGTSKPPGAAKPAAPAAKPAGKKKP